MEAMKQEQCHICKKQAVEMKTPFTPLVCEECSSLDPDRLNFNSVDTRRNAALKAHHHDKFKKAQKNKREKPIAVEV